MIPMIIFGVIVFAVLLLMCYLMGWGEGLVVGGITLVIWLAVEAISFLVLAGLYWVLCWAFGWVFSWKIAVGIWVIYTILHAIFGGNKS